MVSALEAPDTRGRRKTQASKSTWKFYKDCYVCMLGEKKRTKTFGFLSIYQNFVVEVSFPNIDPKNLLAWSLWNLFGHNLWMTELIFVRGDEKNRHHLMEDVGRPTGHYNARIKTLGKLKERWSVKPTKRCVVAVNQIWYLICDLINIKSGKISMFSGRCRGQVG